MIFDAKKNHGQWTSINAMQLHIQQFWLCLLYAVLFKAEQYKLKSVYVFVHRYRTKRLVNILCDLQQIGYTRRYLLCRIFSITSKRRTHVYSRSQFIVSKNFKTIWIMKNTLMNHMTKKTTLTLLNWENNIIVFTLNFIYNCKRL